MTFIAARPLPVKGERSKTERLFKTQLTATGGDCQPFARTRQRWDERSEAGKTGSDYFFSRVAAKAVRATKARGWFRP
jgi:hypothetical protein